MDNLFTGNITEIDVLEFNDPVRRFQTNVTALVLALRIQNFKNPFRTGQRCLNLSVELSQFIDRAGKLFGVNDKRRDHADRDHALQREPGAESRHDHKRQVIDHVHQRSHGIADHISRDADFRHLITGFIEFGNGGSLQIICGDRLPGGDLFFNDPVQLPEQFLTANIIFPHQFRHHVGHHD